MTRSTADEPSRAEPTSAEPDGPGARQPRALLMITDDELAGEVRRVAAVAGCELEQVPDAEAARSSWAEAPLVLLDEAGARACARAGLPRRRRVVLISGGDPPSRLWGDAVAVGAEQVMVLPEGEGWLVCALADVADTPLRPGRVLAVVGGSGGAGASVLAAAVAVAGGAEGKKVTLVDGDPLGGGLDLLFGAEDAPGPRWPDLPRTEGGALTAPAHARMPAVGDAVGVGELCLLSCDRAGSGPTPAAMASVLDAARRAGDTVICDLPRHPSEAALVALDAADLVVLVVPAQVRAAAAAAQVAKLLRRRGTTARLVVRGPSPGGLVPAEVAAAVDLPLLHAMRPQPGLARALEHGMPPGRGRGPLASAARVVLDQLHSPASAATAGDMST